MAVGRQGRAVQTELGLGVIEPAFDVTLDIGVRITDTAPAPVEVQAELGLGVIEPAFDVTLDIGVRITDTAPAPVEVQAANAGLDGGLLEVAFVDTSVVGWETLVTGIQASRPGIEIELIDGIQKAAWPR
jgi:hypothetical protein